MEGSWWADSKGRAEFWLQNQGYEDIRLVRNSISATRLSVPAHELAVFYRQVAVMFSAGIGLADCLHHAGIGAPRRVCGMALLIADRLQAGYSLSNSLKTFPAVFDPSTVALVSASESSGRLAPVLDRLADRAENRAKYLRELLSVLLYPCLLLGVTSVMALVLIFWLLPTHLSLFQQLGTEPTLFQKVAGTLAGSPWLPLAVLVAGGLASRSTELGPVLRSGAKRALLAIPPIRNLYKVRRAHQLLEMMALMLEGGALVSSVLQSMAESATLPRETAKLRTVLEEVMMGEELVEALRSSELFPPLALSLLTAGYEAGRLPALARRASNLLEDEVSHALDTASQLIEPFIMMIVGLISGFLILNLALPMLSVLRNL